MQAKSNVNLKAMLIVFVGSHYSNTIFVVFVVLKNKKKLKNMR